MDQSSSVFDLDNEKAALIGEQRAPCAVSKGQPATQTEGD